MRMFKYVMLYLLNFIKNQHFMKQPQSDNLPFISKTIQDKQATWDTDGEARMNS